MLGTKSKSSRKLTVIVVILAVVIPEFAVMSQYWEWYAGAEAAVENEERSTMVSEDFLRIFLDAGYILYNTESGREKEEDISAEEIKMILRENTSKIEEYENIYPYLEYRVLDEDGEEIAKSTADSGDVLTEKNMSSYELGMAVTYDEYGNPDVRIEAGKYKSEQSVAMREVINEYDSSNLEMETYDGNAEEWETVCLEKPKNRTYLYAMTAQNLQNYIDNYTYTGYYSMMESMKNVVLIMILAVAVLAWFLPVLSFWYPKELRILRTPFEIVVCVFLFIAEVLDRKSVV